MFFHGYRHFRFVGLRNCQQEILLFMFVEQLHEIGKSTVCKEDLAFAVNDIFLQIESYSFGIAKIFHAFGYCDTCFFANAKETVDGSPTGKDHGRMVEDLDPLAAELFE